MPATKTNIYEIMARREKAEKLYLTLARAGATLDQLCLMGDKEWSLAAQAADCNTPSAATRRLVVAIAEQRCAAASYRPTAEEEDAAAGLNEDYDRVYEDRCDYVR